MSIERRTSPWSTTRRTARLRSTVGVLRRLDTAGEPAASLLTSERVCDSLGEFVSHSFKVTYERIL